MLLLASFVMMAGSGGRLVFNIENRRILDFSSSGKRFAGPRPWYLTARRYDDLR